TNCGSIYKDATEIIQGCPKCNWNKFLYIRDESRRSNARKPKVMINTSPEKYDEPKIIPEGSKNQTKKELDMDRVESIRILDYGSYELNLSSLFKREEIVMALKEEGSYIVHLPSIFSKKHKKHGK
ncbi:MAG: Zn-ribbon domain-containing protein, partial [Methanosarcinales archaeon]